MIDIRRALVVGGFINIVGVLVFSVGLTNKYLSQLSPLVFSRLGLVIIMVWGVAYMAVGRQDVPSRSIVGVFALEKFAYSVSWVMWMAVHAHDMAEVFHRSPLTGTFYALYGPIDFIVGVLFLIYVCNGSKKIA